MLDERARAGEPRRAVGADKHAVGARVGHDRYTLLQIRCGAGHASGVGEKAVEDLHQIERRRVAKRHDDRLAGGRNVERRYDPLDPPQIVGVIGNDQCVPGRNRGDAVVRRDQRPQHVDELGGRLVLERVDLGDQPVAACRDRPHRHRRRMLLGIRLGHDLGHAIAFDGCIALQPQRREQRRIHEAHGHRSRRNDVDDALDPRVEHEVAPGHFRNRLDHGFDIRIDEIERDRLVCSAGGHRQKQGGQRGGG